VRLTLIITFLFFIGFNATAQYESNWWYFGDSLSIDFKKGKASPTLQTKVPQAGFQNLSSACVSDKNGNFLFTVNNGFIRDANHQVMANGNGIKIFNSNLASAQFSNSSFAVKKPGKNEEYYIFHYRDTTISLNTPQEIYYSIVDMSMNGGLGAVSVKNVLLFKSFGFKGAATYHFNGKDVWVLFQKAHTPRVPFTFNYGNLYMSYLITASGIQTPVYSVLKNGSITHRGELRFSPQGDKFAVSGDWVRQGTVNLKYQFSNSLVLSKFNNKTGKCFSDIKITSSPIRMVVVTSIQVSNLCFSSDGKKLYAMLDYDSLSIVALRQFHDLTQLDVSVFNKDSIESKKHQLRSADYSRVDNRKNNRYEHLYSDFQLGLDGKIYWKTGAKTIGRINQPNVFGSGCNFSDSVFVLPNDSHHRYVGFPNFFSGYFKFSNIHVENKCFSDSTRFSLLDTGSVASVIWNFGDASPLKSANPTDTVKHSYQRTGVFTVKGYLTHYRGTRDTVSEIITIDTIQIPVLSDSAYTLCNGDTLSLWNTKAAKHFFWNDSTFNDTLQVRNSGKYWYTSYNHCGEWYDTLVVDSAIIPEVNIGRDTVFCSDSITLKSSWKNATYRWQDQSTDSIYVANKTGIYSVTVTNKCGVDSSNISVTVQDTIYPDLGKDTAMCIGDRLVFILNYSGVAYKWFNGWSSNTNVVMQPGKYWVEVSNRCGTQSDTLIVDTLRPAQVNLGNDTATCAHLPLNINAGANDKNLIWRWLHNGSTDSSVVVNASGTYTVEVTDRCGTQTHSIKVYQLNAPNLQMNDTTICEGDSIRITAKADSAQIRWSTGATQPSIILKDYNTYGVGAVNRCGADSAVFKVGELPPPKFTLAADTILCNRSIWEANAVHPRSIYQWNDGSTQPKNRIGQEGTYAVTITNPCGTNSGSINVAYLNTPIALTTISPKGKYCPGTALTLSGNSINENDNYLWNTGDSSKSIRIKEAGNYTLIVSNFCGADTQNITPNYYPIKAAFSINQTEHISPFELEAINQSEGAVEYLWLIDSDRKRSTTNLKERVISYGEHTIVLIAKKPFGCADTVRDTIEVLRNPNIPPLLCDFRIDPNPAKDYFVISASNNDKQVKQVKIFNEIGQEMITSDVSHWKENPFNFEYRLNDLPSGTYLVGLYCENETRYKRLVIVR
jgi:hypothetical protein